MTCQGKPEARNHTPHAMIHQTVHQKTMRYNQVKDYLYSL